MFFLVYVFRNLIIFFRFVLDIGNVNLIDDFLGYGKLLSGKFKGKRYLKYYLICCLVKNF